MGWPQPRPEAVEAALAWLREQDPRLSLGPLEQKLRDQGYQEPEITAAVAARQAELDAALPPGSDLRGRAAVVLVVAFLAVWGVISIALIAPTSVTTAWGTTAALILGALLLPMLLIGLAMVKVSGRLRRGAAGAMVVVLAVPFVYLAVVAGICVYTTQPIN